MVKAWKDEDERKRFFARWINRPVRYTFMDRRINHNRWKHKVPNGEWERLVQFARAAKLNEGCN